MNKVTVLEYEGGNIFSLARALERAGAQVEVTRDQKLIREAEKLIIPGVGAASAVMEELRKYELLEVLRQFERPLLGICLGMQLFGTSSEEGDTECLSIVQEEVKRLPSTVKVPHMGWSKVRAREGSETLFRGIPEDAYFYFVHSFALGVSSATIATAEHGMPISAAISIRNILGVQFHPEKSGEVGRRLLENFIGM